MEKKPLSEFTLYELELELRYNEGKLSVNRYYLQYFCPCSIDATVIEHIRANGRPIKKRIQEINDEINKRK